MASIVCMCAPLFRELVLSVTINVLMFNVACEACVEYLSSSFPCVSISQMGL